MLCFNLPQLQGIQQGWFLDPDNFKFLTSSPAMHQALELFAQLKSLTWPDGQCVLWPQRMLSGECAMTVKWNEVSLSIARLSVSIVFYERVPEAPLT